MPQRIQLPPQASGNAAPQLPYARQITLIGANGSGKTRFMNAMIKACGERAYSLSALTAFTPRPQKENPMTGSIDYMYSEASVHSRFGKQEILSDFDRLSSIILHEEFKSLLKYKSERLFEGKKSDFEPTKLDTLVKMWEKIFPDNQILRLNGSLMFSTPSGDDSISATRLSQGEKTVLYYILATLYAPKHSVIFIDYPTLFLHPAILNSLWNAIEALRPDCTFVYNTHDIEFVNTRIENICVWVKRFDAEKKAWDYQICDSDKLTDDVALMLMGSRKPVLFIEGDASHSIDAKLYTLIFPDYSVRPLGGCNRVIESTRSFNDLKQMHHLDSCGIVDRDRRTDAEVEYLRKRNILVPGVAEVENIFMLEGVIKTMASRRGKNPQNIFSRISEKVIRDFSSQCRKQALMHARHRVKRLVECKIDGRFASLDEMEKHLRDLPNIINPGKIYSDLYHEFKEYVKQKNYNQILKVFNHKPMLSESGIQNMLGYPSASAYISGVLGVIQANGKDGAAIKKHIRNCFEPET